MKETIQIGFMSLTPLILMTYVMFNGYPNLINTLITIGLCMAMFYLLVRKELR